ncbi:MAG TPA: GGDEF domain-containing protein [Thermodesulfovibrionales bacterium]|nr:GGDEF domain-containing protein [Thermodesulfovibrionales bacterium]
MRFPKSRLAIAVTLWGWVLFIAWLSYDYSEYHDRWIVHIIQPAHDYETHGFHVLIILVPFIYTLLGYLVNEREKLLNLLQESEAKFRSLSLQDDLTRLLNRRGFDFLIEQQFKIAARNETCMLLLFVDVDNLKWINDTFNHKEGDNALTATADILRQHIRRADILARFGGDEFIALISNPSPDLQEVLSQRLEHSLRDYNSKARRKFILSFSAGFARYDPSSPCSIEELIDQADSDMYRHKEGKRSNASREMEPGTDL